MKIGKIIELEKIVDPRGNLTVAQGDIDVPFDIKRVYWVYDVPAGEYRGGHAHRQCREVLVALSGSFHVTLDDGTQRETYLLNHPYQGLLIDTGIWRTLDDFSSGAVCLVLASELFEEADYIREYDEYLKYVADKH
ncbi:MAG: WxcM-like domain-containing protein [Prevotella sp.]|nr:WxcM-like domain-containing protein [Prevotella sp.]